MLGGLQPVAWRIGLALGLAFALITSDLLKAQEANAVPHMVQVMIAPAGRVYTPEPVHVSLRNHDQVRWVCESAVNIIFRLEKFPVLADGTRIRTPPFLKMIYSKDPMPRWFPGDCGVQGTAGRSHCDSGALNPELAGVLTQSRAKQLEYVYRIRRGDQPTIEARLVVEP
jgi:hypothetical protein